MSARHSSSTSARDRSSPQQKKLPAELVTYRMDDELVYVAPARDYDQALEYARSVFPILSTLSNSRIAFLVNVRVSGSRQKVRIAPMAWSRVMKSLATYEIIDLAILPESTITTDTRAATSETKPAPNANTSSDNDTPPIYSSSPDHDGKGGYTDSDKSPQSIHHTSDSERLPPPPSSQSVKRGTGAFSWLTRHF